MRQLDVAPGGEIFMRYESRTQRLTQVSEQSLTSAMQRLVRTKNHNILFTSGHGERAINSNTNADLGIFTQQLSNSGFIVDTVNLSTQGSLNPDNGTLVIAGPLHRFLANEVVLLLDYISKGGNLIWLTEPDSDDGLKSRGFSEITLFPQASGLAFKADREWQVAPLVHSTEQSWTETGALSGQVEYGDDTQEVSGPIPLVFALERDVADKKQRVIVAGDGDFLADAWIANGGNRDLGNRLFNWSVGDTAMITLNTPLETDTKLQTLPVTAPALQQRLKPLLETNRYNSRSYALSDIPAAEIFTDAITLTINQAEFHFGSIEPVSKLRFVRSGEKAYLQPDTVLPMLSANRKSQLIAAHTDDGYTITRDNGFTYLLDPATAESLGLAELLP